MTKAANAYTSPHNSESPDPGTRYDANVILPTMPPRDRARTLSPTMAGVFGVALGALFLIALFPLFPRQFNIHVGDVADFFIVLAYVQPENAPTMFLIDAGTPGVRMKHVPRFTHTFVYEHPELPQAAFLLAEAATEQASVAERRGYARLATIQRLRALALEGERARPYTAETELESATVATSADDGLAISSVRIAGLRTRDALEWNGQRQTRRSLTLRVGEHHARVRR